jgi:hypothetical protein
MTTNEMTAVSTLVANYIAAWNETGAAERQQAIAVTWEPEGTYTDPLFDVRGADAINGLIGGFQQQYPGLTFVHTGEIEAHHDLVRFTWDVQAPDGTVIAKGMDVGTVSGNGKLLAIAGFFDQAPVLG